MYESEVFRQEITALKDMLRDTEKSLNIEGLKEQLVEYQEDMASEGFWDDVERAQKVNKQMRSCENRINHYKSLCSRLDDAEVMLELSEEEGGDEMAGEIGQELKKLREEMESLKLTTLLTGQYDNCDCILSLHAGAGGTEAQDWTQMLYRMYTRFGERMGFTVRELDMLDGDEAGVKSVTWEVSGDYAYGFMKSERGVHRLVRISPFDAAARRHTSFASLDVAPVIEDEGEIPIEPDDLRIDTYRASGKGGQHVNRTDSAVRITHLPTGIVVQCQNERSQIQNKETCFRMLRARLAELQEQKRQELMGEVKGELKKIEWGSQIRSYVFQPYTMVKDHRTGYEMGNIDDVMDGDLEGFVTAYLQKL
ncbi:MAG: peptide chain release factor 2 [Clostridia bacterium]|jgi:peptide chain release factor 2|nr:peptide chain release factor 2 [Clostridia bacterium]MBR5751797.1 peptide chain release factor 2 [Clostridia bacterium]